LTDTQLPAKTIIARATQDDAQDILALQKVAYISEAEIYGDLSIPPLHQTLEETRSELQNWTVLKALVRGKIVGSVRARLQSGTCFVGKLIVHPDFQNKGIGTQLLRAIETEFDAAQRYELFTGHRSSKNLHLYQKFGYRIFRQERISQKVTLVYMEKAPTPRKRQAVQD
jgi:ribosomal protein S18 acetylase RimI-like enzyme